MNKTREELNAEKQERVDLRCCGQKLIESGVDTELGKLAVESADMLAEIARLRDPWHKSSETPPPRDGSYVLGQ